MDDNVKEIKSLEKIEQPNDFPGKRINDLISECEKLEKEMKLIADEAKSQYEKRKAEIVEPINKRITEKLEVFRTNKGYKTIFDVSKVAMKNENLPDVTNEFIKFCNEEFEKEKTNK